jgi:hypothetical protein
MTNTCRLQLVVQVKAYLDSCERDFEAAQERLDRARRILDHVTSNQPAATCPTPSLNETAGRADRYGAQVDALLMACYIDETNREE